jgi:hypothetical protein
MLTVPLSFRDRKGRKGLQHLEERVVELQMIAQGVLKFLEWMPNE